MVDIAEVQQVKAMQDISRRCDVRKNISLSNRKKGRAFFAILPFLEKGGWMMMKRSRREDKQKERSFLSEDKRDKEDRERIVKEECHLNKEAASQDGSFRRPKLPPTILRYRGEKFRGVITDNDHRPPVGLLLIERGARAAGGILRRTEDGLHYLMEDEVNY